jgi:hypothetical protein
MNRIGKLLVGFTLAYLACHVGYAMAEIVIINGPTGGQTVCIVSYGVVTCL